MENKLNFEESLARLEEIVRALENGEKSLDDSMKLYEEGVRLIRVCSSELEGAETRIKILKETLTGEIAESDMPVGNAE